MVELGAVSHAQAIELVKADAVIYFEAKPDRKVFESLLATCGFSDMVKTTQLATLGGLATFSIFGALCISPRSTITGVSQWR